MENSIRPGEDSRTYLKRLSDEAAENQKRTVEAAQAHFADVAQTAAAGLARIAAGARDLPEQNQNTLGPLWPDQK